MKTYSGVIESWFPWHYKTEEKLVDPQLLPSLIKEQIGEDGSVATKVENAKKKDVTETSRESGHSRRRIFANERRLGVLRSLRDADVDIDTIN